MRIEDYIRQQPAVLAALPAIVGPLLRRVEVLKQRPERLILVGTGSSMNALVAAGPALEAATGATVSFKEPEAFLRQPPRAEGPRALVLVLSQTGFSLTPIEVVRRSREFGLPTVAVVADDASPLARTGVEMVPIPIGEETVGPKTKGYTASVLTLLTIAGHFGGDMPDTMGLESAMQAAVEASEEASRRLVATIGVPGYILVAGQFGHVGTAIEGALKIAEITGIPTSGYDIEEALHGHVYGTDRNSLLVVIARDEAEARVADNLGTALSDLGPRCAVVNLSDHATRFDMDIRWPASEAGWADATWALFPFQWLALHLSAAKGIAEAGMIYPDLGKRLNVRIRTA